jgi:tyrosinase
MNTHIERKNFYSLDNNIKRDFIEALVRLKKAGIYDRYVIWHAQTMSVMTIQGHEEKTGRNAAHRGPIFLPWHREYIRRFEVDLGMPLPYWKWEAEEDPYKAPIWNWLGGNGDPEELVRNFDTGKPLGYRVKTGPFSYENGWETIEANQAGNPALPQYPRDKPNFTIPLSEYPRAKLARAFGASQDVTILPSIEDVNNSKLKSNYDNYPWNEVSEGFRTSLEGFNPFGLHNQIHVWVLGHMSLNTSPNDPIFFLHHCNVDRIWAEWQRDKPNFGYPEDGKIMYDNGVRIPSHNRNDIMIPWHIPEVPNENYPRIEGVLNHHALGYKYDTEI